MEYLFQGMYKILSLTQHILIMALNYVWYFLLLISTVVALLKWLILGDSQIFSQLLTAMFDNTKTGFEIALGLAGVMSLWLGIMKVGEVSGAITKFSRLISPFFRSLFPGVPKEHPAMGSVMMNYSANMLGLDNAATPLGLKAMDELQEINPQKDTASNDQIMFLVLNTAGLTLIPTSVIAIRQTMAVDKGLTNFNPADIFLPTLVATFVGLISGILIVAAFQRQNIFKLPVLLFAGGFTALIALLCFWMKSLPAEQMASYIGLLGSLIIFSIIMLFLTMGVLRKINVYDTFIEGAKEGFGVAVKIIPYVIAMLVAIGLFRASGCMDFLTNGLASGLALIGVNGDFVAVLPIGIMKSLSGSGARAIMIETMNTYGVDSFQGKLACVVQGSTETTFYVLAVYFGSVGIKKTRHALACGLLADLAGLIGAILVGYLFFK